MFESAQVLLAPKRFTRITMSTGPPVVFDQCRSSSSELLALLSRGNAVWVAS